MGEALRRSLVQGCHVWVRVTVLHQARLLEGEWTVRCGVAVNVRAGTAASHSLADGSYWVMQNVEDQRSLKQYLLGRLSQEEERQLEVRLLADQ
jgi:hypothetical protein